MAANKLAATIASANYGPLVTVASAPVNHSLHFVMSLICSSDLPIWHLQTAHGPRRTRALFFKARCEIQSALTLTASVVSTAIIQRWDYNLSTCSRLTAEEKRGPQAAHRQHVQIRKSFLCWLSAKPSLYEPQPWGARGGNRIERVGS